MPSCLEATEGVSGLSPLVALWGFWHRAARAASSARSMSASARTSTCTSKPFTKTRSTARVKALPASACEG